MSKRGRPSNMNQTLQDRMCVPPKHWSAIRATISRQCKDNYRPEHRRPEWQRGAAEWLCCNQDHVWRVCDYSWVTVQSDPREVDLRGDTCSTKNLAYFQGQNAAPWRKSQNSWECSINLKHQSTAWVQAISTHVEAISRTSTISSSKHRQRTL